MNFYATEIRNRMIDDTPIPEIIDRLDLFDKQIKTMFKSYSRHIIYGGYIDHILSFDVEIVFYSLSNVFDIDNCPSIMVYKKKYDSVSNSITYYILMICTKRKYRHMGYGTKIMDEFIRKIRESGGEGGIGTCHKRIVLSSVYDSVLFYENYGFVWKRNDTFRDHPELIKYEGNKENQESFIMEYVVVGHT